MVTMEQSWSSMAQQPKFLSQPTEFMLANERASRTLGNSTFPQQQGLVGHQSPVMPASEGASRTNGNFTLIAMDSTSNLSIATLGTTANITWERSGSVVECLTQD